MARKIINLGCGTKVSPDPDVDNLDWSWYLKIKTNRAYAWLGVFLDAERRARLAALPGNVIPHDLRRKLPYRDNSVDAVYHSHVLEHIDREFVGDFLRENGRILKSGGIIRVVVPDMEFLSRKYVEHVEDCRLSGHHYSFEFMEEMIEQCVRRESAGTSGKGVVRRFLENIILGDARSRGETHQWMYDQFALESVLKEAGFIKVQKHNFDSSLIDRWHELGLDLDGEGKQYKPGSLYIEAVKP